MRRTKVFGMSFHESRFSLKLSFESKSLSINLTNTSYRYENYSIHPFLVVVRANPIC